MYNKNTDSIWFHKKRPLLIAEIGGNHEGDFKKAIKYLDLAVQSGADCAKFQLYTGDGIVNKIVSPERNQHFKKFELTKNQHIELAKRCIDKGLIYNASVWDISMLDWIDNYLEFYKIGSGDLTCWPLIEEFSRRGKPILISTGLSDFKEVTETVKFIRSVNDNYNKQDNICIMQCTSMYPIDESDVNLNTMNKFRNIPNVAVGYSDHTIGGDALKYAVALGADVLEFHFTDSRSDKKFRDHKISLTKEEVKILIKDINNILLILGDSSKKLLPIEKENNHHISFRRAIYPRKKIKKGEVIKLEDLVFLRPLIGTDAREYKKVINSIALKNLEPLQPIYLSIDFKINKKKIT